MTSLPPEIIKTIATFTQTDDLHCCMLTCKKWQSVFIGHLYRDIHLHSIVQMHKFHQAISINTVELGNYVRRLQISFPPFDKWKTSHTFHAMMALCPHLETLWMPDISFWFDCLLSPNMPDMKSLSRIHHHKPLFVSRIKIMDVSYKFRRTLKHISFNMVNTPYPYLLADPIAYIGYFPQLTHLSVNNYSIRRQNIGFFDDIIHQCSTLKTLYYISETNDLLTAHKHPDEQHSSLTHLSIQMKSVVPDDIYYIQQKFPCLKSLDIHVRNELQQEGEIVDALMSLKHLNKMDILAEFQDITQCEKILFSFWNQTKEHRQSKPAKRVLSFLDSYLRANVVRLSFSKCDTVGFKIVSVSTSVNTELANYLNKLGHDLDELILESACALTDIQLNVITTRCPALTKLTLPRSILTRFSSPIESSHSLVHLTVTEYLENHYISKMIEVWFPQLKSLCLKWCKADGCLPRTISVQLPETGLESLNIDVGCRSNCAVYKIIDDTVLFGWYYCAVSKKTIMVDDKNRLNNQCITSKGEHLILKSSTLKSCTLH
ncbi:hypothetical protein BDB01DRAFT_91818 [Pilobolus umbonatus]|nr:hypothetical protein BDB01DRAFT_91818 [Pilobolus umbonatus]